MSNMGLSGILFDVLDENHAQDTRFGDRERVRTIERELRKRLTLCIPGERGKKGRPDAI